MRDVREIVCYSNPQDHSIDRGFMFDCCPTLNAAAGNSGNNRPFVVIVSKKGINLGLSKQEGFEN